MSLETIHYCSSKQQDLATIALVVERANAARDGEVVPSQLQDPVSIGKLQASLDRPGAWLYTAQAGATTVGVALGYPRLEADQQHVEYLSLLMVDPNFWGKRIASGLLSNVYAQAKADGKQQVALWTRQANNERTREIYEHKGFTLSGVTRTHEQFGEQVEYILGL